MAKQVFEDIKIADFSWFAAGPWTTKCFADHGATVVRIESSRRVDGHRTTPPFKDSKPGVNRSAVWATGNNNKYGVTLNLQHPRGLEIARRFIAWADVVVENFTPGTVKRLGLDYEKARGIKPDIIYLSTSNQGQTGPHAHSPGFGSHLSSAAGFVSLTGWPDRDPAVIFGPYTDFIAIRFGIATLAAALDYRRRTGKGQYIDLSQYECSLHLLAPLFLDYQVNGQTMSRNGNRSSCAAPHGVYPCKGDDRWIAIAVFTEDEWQALRKAMGEPGWADDPRFSSLSGRKSNEEELEARISQWTKNFTAEELMEALQKAGVRSGVAQNARDVYYDVQLRHRRQLQELEHAEIGKHTYPAPSFILSKTPSELRMPAPCLGQHNAYVYTQILGLSDEQFVELQRIGALD